MICVRITGGLGNQLFQYAMGRRLALHHGVELLLDTTGYGENGEVRPSALQAFARPLALCRFCIEAKIATTAEIAHLKDWYCSSSTRDRLVRVVRRLWPTFLWKASHIVERQYRFQPEALSFPDNVYLQGYWQSEKYFADVAGTIRQELQLQDSALAQSVAQFVETLRERHGEVVSVHVRRGDLAHAHEVLRQKNLTYGAPVTMDYLQHAMSLFPAGTCFLVFSDSPKDIRWCRENIRGECLEFSGGQPDLWDFLAMSCCDHHIIANSTFSWWAAWLDNKQHKKIIAPRTWSSPESRVDMAIDDLIPEGWTIL